MFLLKITFDENYPNKPPNCQFTTPLFHPNIYADGRICLDILQSRWSPTYDVTALLTSIQSLLPDPNPDSPANGEAASLYKNRRREYEERVRACALHSLNQDLVGLGVEEDAEDAEDVDDLDDVHDVVAQDNVTQPAQDVTQPAQHVTSLPQNVTQLPQNVTQQPQDLIQLEQAIHTLPDQDSITLPHSPLHEPPPHHDSAPCDPESTRKRPKASE